MIEWINEFQISVSIVKIMCNPALRDRHWLQMSEIAGHKSFQSNEISTNISRFRDNKHDFRSIYLFRL